MIGRGLVVLAAVLAGAGCSIGADAPSLPPGRAILATPSLDPAVHLFGDPVVARLTVVVDARRVDPDTLRLEPRFFPYERIGSPAVTRRDHGEIAELRYAIRLRCLGPLCVPRRLASAAGPDEPGRGERTSFRFPASRLLRRDGNREQVVRVIRWPALESVSRINESQFQAGGFPFRPGHTPLPEVTWLLPPPLLAAIVGALSLALLAPGVLVLRRRRRERRPVVEEEEPELPPLERALLLVEWARDRPAEDRRRALEVLADALEREGPANPADAADAARALAWSAVSPSPRASTALLERVRAGMNGRPD